MKQAVAFGLLSLLTIQPVGAQWALGGPLVLFEDPTSPEGSASVAIDGSGRFYLTFVRWQRVTGRAFDAEARPLGAAEELGPEESIPGYHPTVAMGRRGMGWAAWNSSPSGGGGPWDALLGRSLGEGGATVSSLQRLSSQGPFSDYSARISVRDGLSGVGVWYKVRGLLPFRFEIEVRTIDPEGTLSDPLVLAEGGGGDDPFLGYDVAALPGGDFLYSWSGSGADSSGSGVRLRLYQVDGTPRSDEIQVNETSEGHQYFPRVAADASGRFVVAWVSENLDGSSGRIYARRFDTDGTALGPEFRVSSEVSHHYVPSVAMDAAGNFVVAWNSLYEDDLPQTPWVRAYRPDGTPYGPQQPASLGIFEKFGGSVALSDSGVFVIAFKEWREVGGQYSFDILGRRYALPCEPGETTLCLRDGRFLVRAFWRTPAEEEGSGQPLPLSPDAGGFWFFHPDNFELLVKVLDGCGVTGSYWLFAAGLTDVEVDLIVTDTWTGTIRTVHNPAGTAFQPFLSTDLFPTCDAVPPAGFTAGGEDAGRSSAREEVVPVNDESARAPAEVTSAGLGLCEPGPAVHCFGGGRFRATASWREFQGLEGAGQAQPLSDDSGLFWFFWPDNVELALKVLDGCGVNDHYWVFATGLTNVAVELRVEDLQTGAIWQRATELGQPFPPYLDTSAFAACP